MTSRCVSLSMTATEELCRSWCSCLLQYLYAVALGCQAVITKKLGAPSSLLGLLRYLAFTQRIRTVATESGSKEQAALLTTACANSSRIQRLVTNAVAIKSVCVDGPGFVGDAILRAERALLEICDVKGAARSCNDLAERCEEKSVGPADRIPGDPFQPVMRAYLIFARDTSCLFFQSVQRWRAEHRRHGSGRAGHGGSPCSAVSVTSNSS